MWPLQDHRGSPALREFDTAFHGSENRSRGRFSALQGVSVAPSVTNEKLLDPTWPG